ncbi:MAG: hypothetical protein IPK82_38895 [Polyangiaceae bacterium]|nr:hypothetical protein [Polyangiaceae bacterium]
MWTKLVLWGTTALLAAQVTACCKIFDNGKGDDSTQNDGPDPVTGDLPPPRNGFLADLGFRPKTHGYNFENGGNAAYPRTPGFVGPAEMVRLFGAKDVCIGGRTVGASCRMTPAAAEFARKVNKSMNGGQCEGMAVSALTFFRGIDQISAFAPSARTAHDTNREQVRGLIGYYFAYQFSDPVIAAKMDAKRRYTPVQTMDRVVELIQKGDPGVLFMRSPDNMSGHAVSPYAVEDRGNGIYWIRIYDNNWTNRERYVEVDKNLNTWKYELAAINPGVPKMPWAGNATSYTFGVVPISVRRQKIVCPFCKKTRTRGVLGDSSVISNMVITDDQGRSVGMKDGKAVNEIPGARVVELDGWIDGQPTTETMYELPEGSSYDIDMEGKENAKDEGDVVIFGGGTAVTIENVKVPAKQKDRVSLDADGTGIRYKPAAKGKVPPMKVALDDDKHGYVFQVSNVDNDDDDDDDDKGVTLKLDPGAGKVQIFGSGKKANKAYDLKITRQKESDQRRRRRGDEGQQVRQGERGSHSQRHCARGQGQAHQTRQGRVEGEAQVRRQEG